VDNVDKLELIKETLNKKGVSQTKLADLLGVNLTTVNNWFRRGSIPNRYIDNISLLFNLKLSENKEGSNTIEASVGFLNGINNDLIENEAHTSMSTIKIKHIDDNKRIHFSLDRSIIEVQDIYNLRFNLSKSTSNYVDIIDINVDNYCGDGVYYIQYPHKVIIKKVQYNFNRNSYTVFDVEDSTSKIEVNSFNNKIIGKVIIRIEVFN